MKKSTLLVFLFFLATVSASAQLQKGDIEISFSSNFSKGKEGQLFSPTKFSSFQLTPSLGYMVSDKIMVGGGVGVVSSKSENRFGELYTHRSYQISPFGRYYFYRKNNISTFLFANSYIGHFKYDFNSVGFDTGNGWAINVSGGFGVQYYLAPNLAIHGELGTILFENEYGGSYSNLIFANFGIRTFLNDRTRWSGSLLGAYLKKGNAVLSGEIKIRADDNYQDGLDELSRINANSMYTSLRVLPTVKYFVKDKLALTFGPGVETSGNGNYKQSNYSLDFGLEGYVPLCEQFYLVPSLDIGFEKRNSKYHSVEPIFLGPLGGSIAFDTIQRKEPSILNTGRFALSFKYFTKGAAIFSTGAFYGVNHYVVKEHDYKRINNQWGLYAGFEYFIAKNISIAATGTYSRGESRLDYRGAYPYIDTQENELIDIDFSVKYFIFR